MESKEIIEEAKLTEKEWIERMKCALISSNVYWRSKRVLGATDYTFLGKLDHGLSLLPALTNSQPVKPL